MPTRCTNTMDDFHSYIGKMESSVFITPPRTPGREDLSTLSKEAFEKLQEKIAPISEDRHWDTGGGCCKKSPPPHCLDCGAMEPYSLELEDLFPSFPDITTVAAFNPESDSFSTEDNMEDELTSTLHPNPVVRDVMLGTAFYKVMEKRAQDSWGIFRTSYHNTSLRDELRMVPKTEEPRMQWCVCPHYARDPIERCTHSPEHAENYVERCNSPEHAENYVDRCNSTEKAKDSAESRIPLLTTAPQTPKQRGRQPQKPVLQHQQGAQAAYQSVLDHSHYCAGAPGSSGIQTTPPQAPTHATDTHATDTHAKDTHATDTINKTPTKTKNRNVNTSTLSRAQKNMQKAEKERERRRKSKSIQDGVTTTLRTHFPGVLKEKKPTKKLIYMSTFSVLQALDNSSLLDDCRKTIAGVQGFLNKLGNSHSSRQTC